MFARETSFFLQFFLQFLPLSVSTQPQARSKNWASQAELGGDLRMAGFVMENPILLVDDLI